MIPPRGEYLFLLLVFALIMGTLLWDYVLAVLRRPAFYKALLACVLVFTIIDLVAIRRHWWFWSPERTLGLTILHVPLEEFILFVFGYTFCIAVWELLGRDVA